MPTTGYLAGTDANDLELSFANETTWGTSPTGVNYQKFRVNSESFAEQKNRSAPPELRNDGQTADKSTQDVQARGGVQFGISYGNMDWAYANLVAGAFSTPLAIDGDTGDISFEASGNQITSGTTDKFIDVVVGQWIDVQGCSTNAARMFLLVTGKPDDETLVVAGVTLANETPTGAAVKIRGSMLRNAQVVNKIGRAHV